MEFICPHCSAPFTIPDPFQWAEPHKCPACGQVVYLEIDEGDEGPIFTLYRHEPDSRLYPPEDLGERKT